MRREERRQREEDHRAELAREEQRNRCGWCFRPYVPLRRGVFKPVCHCEKLPLRARFAGV
jgi:hypothetical protein